MYISHIVKNFCQGHGYSYMISNLYNWYHWLKTPQANVEPYKKIKTQNVSCVTTLHADINENHSSLHHL